MIETAGAPKPEKRPTTEERNDLQVALAPAYLEIPASEAMREWISDGGPSSYAALFAEYEEAQAAKGKPMSYSLSKDNLEAIKKGMEELRLANGGQMAEAA